MANSDGKKSAKNIVAFEPKLLKLATNAMPDDSSTKEAPHLADMLVDARSVIISEELNTLYHIILAQVKRLIDQADAFIFIRENDEIRIVIDGNGKLKEQRYPITVLKKELPAIENIILNKEPKIVEDIWSDANMLAFIKAIPDQLLLDSFGQTRSWLGVPILLNQQPVGILNLMHRRINYFTLRHASLATTVVTNVAKALTRLSTRTQTLAVLEERQRIARELHDSVTQVFYGIELNINIARTLLKRQEIDQTEQTLVEVLKLAEAGLTEMRALLFELRPEALESEGLVAALKKHIAMLRVRHNITVEASLGEEPQISLATKEALYRIGQEAMQNIVKHARASLVTIQLSRLDHHLLLTIQDNGRGFDTRQTFPGHLGLTSMRERVAKLEGSLEIDSRPGMGTLISAWVPVTTDE